MALYQQFNRRIEIIVRKEIGGTARGTKQKDTDNVSSDKKTDEETGMSSKTKKMVRTNLTHAFATARQLTLLKLNDYVNSVGYKQGDQALQENTQRRLELIQDTTSVASSVGMGLTYGASAGPVGMVLGALFGAVSTMGSIHFKYEKRERENDYKVFKENNAIEYQRARASISLTTGRLR